MRLAIKVLKTAVVVSFLAVAACGGNGPADLRSSQNGNVAVVSGLKSAAAAATSPNGTTIPSATPALDIALASPTVDAIANPGTAVPGGGIDGSSYAYDSSLLGSTLTWSGVNFALGTPDVADAITSSTITIAANSYSTLYMLGTAVYGSQAGQTFVVTYTDGTTTTFTQSMSDWGAPQSYAGESVALAMADRVQPNGTLDARTYNLYGYSFALNPAKTVLSFTLPANDHITVLAIALTPTSQIVDAGGNVWTVVSGVAYENGALAGYSNDVTLLLYENSIIYQENSAGGWWSWNGTTWVASSEPPTVPVGSIPPTLSGSPPTAVLAGEAYNFVPATTNPGGGTLVFSISNMPAWARFSTVTGALTGTPGTTDAGAYSNILISVTNGSATASLAAFAITVTTGSASLSWDAVTQNTDGTTLTDLAGYTIYYGTSSDALTQTIQLNSPAGTSDVVGNLGAGTYYFAVAAYTTTGTQGILSAVGSKTIE
jgi:hypothetical protein